MNFILYKLFLWEIYFMTGYSKTQVFKYLIMAYGLWEATGQRDIYMLISVGTAYAIICFLIGFIWYHFHLVNIEAEIGNQYNPFMQQVREKFEIERDVKNIK